MARRPRQKTASFQREATSFPREVTSFHWEVTSFHREATSSRREVTSFHRCPAFSYGWAQIPGDATERNELMSLADRRMYEAKARA